MNQKELQKKMVFWHWSHRKGCHCEPGGSVPDAVFHRHSWHSIYICWRAVLRGPDVGCRLCKPWRIFGFTILAEMAGLFLFPAIAKRISREKVYALASGY